MEHHSLAETLCLEVRELSLGLSGEIERIQGPPTPVRFLRDFVLPNKPCIITNAIDHWPALASWTNAYLRTALQNQFVSVHSTPDGFADAVVDLGCLDRAVHPGVRTGEAHRDQCSRLQDDGTASKFSLSGGLQKELSRDTHRTHLAFCQADIAPVHKDVAEVQSISQLGKNLTNDSVERPAASCAAIIPPPVIGLKSREQVSYGGAIISTPWDDCTALHCKEHASSINRQDCVNTLSVLRSHDLKPSSADVMVVKDLCSEAAGDAWGKEEFLDQAWFVTAHVDRVPFSTALDMIVHSEIGSGVAYAQEQNGCFLSEYSVLSADAETHLPWATEAFGCFPEAVNLWIGNEKAVTSFHKDHYENLYAVIAGEKHFTLLPPTDVHRLYIRQYPSAHYVKDKGGFAIEQEKPIKFVPWTSVNPYPPAESACEAKLKFPKYFDGPEPFTCTLRAGEILYLPSLWFHHVRQTPDSEGRTVALNFWYDMQFDIKYAYYNFLEALMLKL